MSKSSLKVLPALLAAIGAALITQTVCGQMPTPTPVITFTEINNTTLSAVYTNSAGVMTPLTVNPQGTDSWIVTTPSFLFVQDGSNWFEPSSTTSVNRISPETNSWFVSSDQPPPPAGIIVPANDTISNRIALDTTNTNSPVLVYGIFNDLGDTPATVPDTG